MTRKCSHCSHNGHNSRTCPNRGVKIFGVRLSDGLIRKSASMGNLSHYMGSGSGSGSTTPQNGVVHGSPADTPDHPSADGPDGYASEDFVAGSGSGRERKRGVPWTEEEHRMFLLGLQKLGKGDWRGIARTYVITRTPTQVASHAQKYFIRQSNVSRRKRRSSLFDIVADDSADTPPMSRDFFSANPDQIETQSNFAVPPPALDEECEYMESADSNDGDATLPNSEALQYSYQSASSNDLPAPEGLQYPYQSASFNDLPVPESLQYPYPVMYPAYVAPFYPMPIPVWAGYSAEPVKEETHEVLKPTPVHSKSPINVDELVSMSKLSIGEKLADAGPSTVSLELVEGSERPSAFHANNPSSGGPGLKSSHNPIHAL